MNRLAIDLDGVLAASIDAVIEKLNVAYRKDYTKKDITDWHKTKELFRVTEKELLYRLDQSWEDYLSVEPEEALLSLTTAKLNADYGVSIMTRRTRPSYQYVCKWLDFHQIRFNDLIFVGRGSKVQYLSHFSYYIDDRSKNLYEAMKVEGCRLFLKNQPWNTLTSGDFVETIEPVVTRVESLKELSNLI